MGQSEVSEEKMVNLAISSLEGSHQKALLMASLSSLTRTLDKDISIRISEHSDVQTFDIFQKQFCSF